MKRNTQVINDDILKEAVVIYTEKWLENYKTDCEIELSLELQEKIQKIINTPGSITKTPKIKTKILILVAVLIILLSTLTVGAVRTTIKNFFVKYFSNHNTISYSESSTKKSSSYPKTIEKVYQLTNVPAEYELITSTVTETSTFVLYLNSDKQIVFEQHVKDFYTENINNENSIVNIKTIGDIEYYISYIELSKEYKIIWEYDHYVFCLTGGLSEDKMIELCETITIS